MSIKKDLDKAITESIVKIIQEPLIYFSEADVQQQLCDSIKSIFSLSRLYPTSVKRGKGSKSVYKTSLVHREYGGGKGRRIDIVILDKKDLLEIDSPNLTKKGRYLKPKFAIEVGTEKTKDTRTHIKRDLEKLKKSTNKGYLIHIYKDITRAKSGTLSRQKTEEKIKNNFKDIFSTIAVEGKINVIAVLIRTYRNQARMRGKCEIFNNGIWEKINVNDKKKIESKLMGVMN
ncbi:MAG: hypothetical protein MAG795_00050 [Candidatus Woesearchaeota archaeon]|nr:hypothetical protein [Candidatus Woesearchaeota archaeon]